MSQILEQMREESRRKGKEEGKIEGKKEIITEIAKKMLAGGSLTTQQISEYLELPVEEIERIKLNLAD